MNKDQNSREYSSISILFQYNTLCQNPSVWVKSNKEGVERVLKEDGQYAFMMESTVVDYVVERQVSFILISTMIIMNHVSVRANTSWRIARQQGIRNWTSSEWVFSQLKLLSLSQRSDNFLWCRTEFNLSDLIYLYLRFPLSDTYDQRNSSAARGWKIASFEGEMVETNEGRGAVRGRLITTFHALQSVSWAHIDIPNFTGKFWFCFIAGEVWEWKGSIAQHC